MNNCNYFHISLNKTKHFNEWVLYFSETKGITMDSAKLKVKSLVDSGVLQVVLNG